MACSTQWRTQGTQAGLVWIGLDYTACRVMLEAQELPLTSLVDFPQIEEAVLPVFNQRHEDGGED